MIDDVPTESDFWDLANPMIEAGAVTRSTMMGLPCLRVNGEWVWWQSAAGMAIPATRPYVLGDR